jgi:hypothetical protein
MALVLADRVQDVTTTTGTGTITLANTPPTGFQSFAVIGNGNTTYYAIYGGNDWEVGIGAYTAIGTSLSRDTVLSSSNSGNLVNFGSGDKAVFVTYPAEKSVNEDASGNVNINITGSAVTATTATNLAAGAAGSVPYQTAANTTAFVATASGVLVGGTTPSFSTAPTLTGTNFTAIPNAALSNNAVTIGTTAISLGATSTTLAGLTSVTLTQDPTLALQAATKQYVDTQTSAGIHFHTPARVEAPANLNATYNNGTAGVGATLTNAGTQAALVIDGVTLSVADRVLISQQTTQTENGIYVVTSVGSVSTNWVLTRSSDADTYVSASPAGLSEGSTVFVQQGTINAGTVNTCNTVGTITFGVTNITFAEISSSQIYSAGTGLTLSGTQFSLTTPVATTLGGTGLTTFGAANRAIFSSGTTTLTAGTLPIAAGGTAHTSYTDGQLLIGKSSDGSLEKATLTQGTGITITNGSGAITVTNSAPDQTVSLTGGGTTTIGGSYPNFSISSADQYVGTVTSVGGTGTVNGLTLTGTVTSSGSLTLGGALTGVNLASQVTGVLPTANGGTNLSSFTSGGAVYATSTSALTTGTLPVASGGTGSTTFTANNVLLGNGTSALQAVAPSTAGNLLTSNGTTWVSQAAPPSGPTLQATLSGTLADGSRVIVNANGTVTPAQGATQELGSAVVYSLYGIGTNDVTYDVANQRIVAVYRDGDNLYKAVVGTVSGTSITFGTPVTFADSLGFLAQCRITYHAAAQKVVIAYIISGTGYAIVGTVSGTSISFGAQATMPFTFTQNNNGAIVYDSTNQKVVVATVNSGTTGVACVGTVSGTSISFGSTSSMFTFSMSSVSVSMCFDPSTSNVVVVAGRQSSFNGGSAVVGTVSGTSISFGAENNFVPSGNFQLGTCVYDSVNQKVVVFYKTNANSTISGIVGTVSGTSISFGSATGLFGSASTGERMTSVYDTANSLIVLNYINDSNNAVVGNVIISGGLTQSVDATAYNTNTQNTSVAYDSVQQRIVFAYANNGNSGKGTGRVFRNGSNASNVTAENFIGFSNGAYTTGQTATIQIVGSVDDAQSGLTAGQSYYVQQDGTLGLTPASPSVFAGTAVSATKIIVKG